MNASDYAKAAEDRSPLLPGLHEFNTALRRLYAAQAWLEASTSPVADTPGDTPAGWAGYRAAQERRLKGFHEAETDLGFARRRAEAALNRSLTAEEAASGFVATCRPGHAGVPLRPEYVKPGRRVETAP